jgi:ABC-type Mn2+/Zn2+ transport system ATPase subunit
LKLIELQDAAFGYGRRAILSGVSCAIEAGDVVGLVGPNGAGKTTFLRGILGLLPAMGGRAGVDRSKRFAYVPQAEELNVYWPLTLRQTVLLALRSQRLLGRVTDEERERAEVLLRQVGIAEFAHLLLREASGGQRQRTILAQALSQKPDVLVLDEPTRGLDVVAERDFLALILELKRTQNLTVLLVTHTLQIPLNFAEKILLFKEGAVITATPEELVSTDKLSQIYGTPFRHAEAGGLKWVSPARAAG